MLSVFATPDDCLKPGDVRAMKRLASLTTLEDAVVPGAPAAPQLVDFTAAGAAVPGAPGSPLNFFLPFANDATVVATPGVGLQINPAPQAFTHTVDQAGVLTPGAIPIGVPLFDRVKYLVVGAPVDAPDDGREIGHAATVAARQTYANPKFPAAFIPHITNLERDFRPSSLAVVCIDPDHGTFFDFAFTNDTIYAFYDASPLGKPGFGGPGPDYNAGNGNVALARRDTAAPLADFVTVQVAYNRAEGYVRWLIDGVEKHRLSLIGKPFFSGERVVNFGGPAVPLTPTRLQFGFGLFSTLDATRPLDPGVDDGAAAANKPLVALYSVPPNPPLVVQPPTVYYDPIRVTQGNGPTAGDPVGLVAADFVDPLSLVGNRLFGQGAQGVVRSWQAYIQ